MASTATTVAPLGAASDGQLVQQHLDGRRDAFEVLYRRYFRRLVWLLSDRTSGTADAEDLAQETLLRALRHADRFDTTAPMWPWLKTIALRLAIDNANRKASSERPCSFDGEDGLPEPAEDPDLVRLVEADPDLAAAFRQLTARHQVALRLRYLEGWSREDAAAFLDINLNAFDQLVHRASARIRSEYEKLAGGQGVLGPLPLGGLLDRWRRVVVRVRSRYAPVEVGLASGTVTPDAVASALVAVALVVAGTTASAATSGAPLTAQLGVSQLPSMTLADDVNAERGAILEARLDARRTVDATAQPSPSHPTPERRRVFAEGSVSKLGGGGGPADATVSAGRESDGRDSVRVRVERYLPGEPPAESAQISIDIYCDERTRQRSVTAKAACGALDVVEDVVPPPDDRSVRTPIVGVAVDMGT